VSAESLIPAHGGYRHLKSFQIAQLAFDVTVRFSERYIAKNSRTRDQMVQAARSGVQNIAEGSQASGTSKKTELKLTNVARASLEELRLDYEDYLRQRGLEQWPPANPALVRFKARRCATLQEVQAWVQDERLRASADEHGQKVNLCPSSAQFVANAALSLLNLACYLLDRQIAVLAEAFQREGGFTERLYRIRTQTRNQQR
jgi:four helix bundle suffix protein